MDPQSLKDLISSGESAVLELKIAPPRQAELAERVCGLANSGGGQIVIGVADKTLELRGVEDTSAAVDSLLKAARLCHPTVPFYPAEPEIVKVNNRALVVGTIRPRQGVLYQAGGIFWKRRGTFTVPITLDEIVHTLNNQGLILWELQPVQQATLEDLDLDLVKLYLAQRSTRSRKGGRLEDLERILINLNCVVEVGEGAHKVVRPTNAGLLVFGLEPQQFLIQSEVTCVLYRDALGVGGYADRRILSGSLGQLIDGTEQFFKRNVPVKGRIEGFHRIDEPAVPLEALREGVVNALVHRDWSRRGESVRIFYYSNRIEIHSPGELMPDITVEQLAAGEAPSKLRNPIITSLLRDLPGGYMERLGSGIRLMIKEMQRSGKPAPEFHNKGEISVTFWLDTEKNQVDSGLLLSPDLKSGSALEDLTIIKSKKAGSLEVQGKRLEAAMLFVQQNSAITSRQYRALSGVSENTATRDLEQLVVLGALKAVGQRRGRYYTLP